MDDRDCRYSVFMSASLFITAVTTTSSLLRASSFVIDLSECTHEDSECLRDVQRWVYNRFLKSLVRIDVDVLDLQDSPLCAGVQSGDASGIIAEGSITDLTTTEVPPPTPLPPLAVTIPLSLRDSLSEFTGRSCGCSSSLAPAYVIYFVDYGDCNIGCLQ